MPQESGHVVTHDQDEREREGSRPGRACPLGASVEVLGDLDAFQSKCERLTLSGRCAQRTNTPDAPQAPCWTETVGAEARLSL